MSSHTPLLRIPSVGCSYLSAPVSQELLIVIVFCKTHLAAGKKSNTLVPVVETQPSTRLHLQYLTSWLRTWLVGAEFFMCAQEPRSV